MGNLEAMALAGLETEDPRASIAAALALAELARFTGLSAAAALREPAMGAAARLQETALAAKCLSRFGNLMLDRSEHAAALGRSEHGAARDLYQQALLLYRRVGDVIGEANCIQGLGDVALAAGERTVAEGRFAKALALYRRTSEPYSIGGALVRLARLAAGGQRRSLVQEAKSAWESIDRPDLVAELRAEFGDLAESPHPDSSLRSE